MMKEKVSYNQVFQYMPKMPKIPNLAQVSSNYAENFLPSVVFASLI